MKLVTNNNSLSRNWMFLSVISLAVSGLFAIFLVIGRSPYINQLLPHVDFFKTSLTIHVNLSVTVWLLSMIVCVFSFDLKKRLSLHKAFLYLSCLGAILISLSIFDGSAESFLNNYIPIINSSIFKLGIYAFLIGIAGTATLALLEGMNGKIVNTVIFPSIIFFAAATYLASLYQLEYETEKNLYNDADYFELLFWGAGHIIQYAYVQLVIYAWLTILNRFNGKDYKKLFISSGIINIIASILGMVILYFADVNTAEYKIYFTDHMIYFAGVAPTYVAICIIKDILIKNFSSNYTKTIYNCLIWSAILFASGGLIGFNISEINTVIPAHYHGSIVSISLGAMAICYMLLETYGYNTNFSTLARIQPILYGAGQLIHITGFALSGGYGALRKSPGTLESMEGKLYMGLMGLGGLISIIGGLIFIVVILRAVKHK